MTTFQEVVKEAKEYLVKHKEHPPLFIMSNNGELTKFNPPMNDEEQKERVIWLIDLAVNIRKPEHYFVVLETWIVSKSYNENEDMDKQEKENMKIRPSKSPERKEALVIEQHCNDLKSTTMICLFERDKDGNIVLGEEYFPVKNERTYSKFNFYLEGR